MLLSDRIKEDGITIQASPAGYSDDGDRRTWTVTLHRSGLDGHMSLLGPFESNLEVTRFDVMRHLLLHCSTVDQCDTREEWAAEYTSDPEEQVQNFTQDTFEGWREINARLRRFLGGERYRSYLYDTTHDG